MRISMRVARVSGCVLAVVQQWWGHSRGVYTVFKLVCYVEMKASKALAIICCPVCRIFLTSKSNPENRFVIAQLGKFFELSLTCTNPYTHSQERHTQSGPPHPTHFTSLLLRPSLLLLPLLVSLILSSFLLVWVATCHRRLPPGSEYVCVCVDLLAEDVSVHFNSAHFDMTTLTFGRSAISIWTFLQTSFVVKEVFTFFTSVKVPVHSKIHIQHSNTVKK